MTVVVVMSTPTIEGGCVVVFDNAAATVTASGSVADGRIMRTMILQRPPCLEKGKSNKNGTEDIGIQAFNAILQLGVGYQLIA